MRRVLSTFLIIGLIGVAAPLAAQEEAADTMAQEEAQPMAPDMEVTQAVVATGVQDREPVGVDSTFTADVGTLYFYTTVEGDFDQMQIEHVWTHDGEEIARVPLTVRGPRWRTWSSKDILPDWTGDWTVSVVGPDGTEYASVDFTVGGM